MSSGLIIFLLVLLIVGIMAVILLLLRKNTGGSQQTDEKLIVLLEKVAQLGDANKDLRGELDRKLAETHRTTQDHFGQTTRMMQADFAQSAKLIADVTERLTKLDETNRQVINFSAQLQNLQDILKNPKQRGVLGEYFLEETLKNHPRIALFLVHFQINI